MRLLKKKTINIIILSLFLSVIFPLTGNTRVAVLSDIATGQVIRIQDNVITLDSGVSYYPANKNMKIDIKVGDVISIRIISDTENMYQYTEIAIGKNSLSHTSITDKKQKRFK
jgi:hypothetical protein